MKPVHELTCEPLTAKAFAPFGMVLQTGGRKAVSINQGLTDKFTVLEGFEVDAGARLQLAVYHSRPVTLPFELFEVERHPLAGQAFWPLHDRPFPLIVAPPGPAPRVGTLRVFLTNGRQGVYLAPGTWHHHQLTLGEAGDYLVIERETGAGNCDVATLSPAVILVQGAQQIS